jgi:hypothetical protein
MATPEACGIEISKILGINAEPAGDGPVWKSRSGDLCGRLGPCGTEAASVGGERVDARGRAGTLLEMGAQMTLRMLTLRVVPWMG